MKGFPIAHIFHPSIPPMRAVVNNHNRNIDYWTVKRKFAEIVSTNDVNKIYSISNELRRVLSAITALNFYHGDVPSVMIRIQPENMSPFIIDISTGEHDDGNDSNLLIVFYVQIMPDDFVMQLHRF
ncbi:hypothetical protein VEE34_05760 [Escherichia coli]|nr:hypothetical protein VEE34_05760 [Escherichia coli]